MKKLLTLNKRFLFKDGETEIKLDPIILKAESRMLFIISLNHLRKRNMCFHSTVQPITSIIFHTLII